MIRPQAFIFDMDGVLANTIDLHFDAWKRLAESEGVTFTAEDMDRTLGWKRREIIADIIAPTPLTPATYARLSKLKDDLYLGALHNRVPEALVLPGAVNTIYEARRRRIRVGVASSSMSARLVLEHAGLLNQVDAIADGHTVKRSKPAPDVFVWVAGALGIAPSHAIAFEDAAAGVQAARTAGMFVVGLGQQKLVQDAHLFYSGLDAIDLDEILTRFASFHSNGQPATV